ncbi:MAG: hypothetical protein QM780_17855 [Hyphomicrobium sp.]|uniref:hypothetical protein n=1 Tax=Hyphomicrobium sp. TaxID=82 RepID=UPI0039E284E3
MKITALLVAIAATSVCALTAHAETVDPAQAIAQKFSEASEEQPKSPQRTFDKPGSEYEEDMLQQARIEEFERQQQEARDTPKPSSAAPTAVPAVPAAIVAPPAPAPAPKLAALPPKPVPEPPRIVAEAPSLTPTSATVLLVLDPYGTGLDIKPDPIICIDNNCWLSSGMTSPSRQMPRNQAVALESTDDQTGESCAGKSGCVYRNVTIDPASRIDVIEVGEGGGASVGAYTVGPDKSCRTEGNALLCNNGVATQNFRIWIVPEATAAAAGAASLENAVAEGLPPPETDTTSANDK